ncbi:MAG: ParB/RepB/Spo0J family partition protein [Agathobacter sp.]
MAKLAKFSENTSSLIKPEHSMPKGKSIKPLHYTKLRDSEWQYCDEKDKEEIIHLAWLIDACKGIQQPLLVRKIDVDEYEIIAGHKRRRASAYLVEELGKTEYEFVPCIVLDASDVVAEFNVYASNGFHDKTDYEIMHELTHMKNLLENHPEEFPHLASGRMIDKLASQMNMKRSTVGEYLQISKNLSDKGMEAFQTGELNKSAAVAISALPRHEQDQLLDEGVTKHKDIKAYKEEKVEKTVHRTTVTDTVKTVKTHSIDEPQESVPKFGTEEPEVIDVLPGQLKVTNTDMEVVEEVIPVTSNKGATIIQEESSNQCTCSVCGRSLAPAKTYVFYGKPYCTSENCLEKLLMDLEDTGVITINRSEITTRGNVIRS